MRDRSRSPDAASAFALRASADKSLFRATRLISSNVSLANSNRFRVVEADTAWCR